ncbi:MAG: hypothetical protein JNK48_13325 [Bryobacterales bacterium]|nr:hypothetical protein [Bryobacterales bacterium]
MRSGQSWEIDRDALARLLAALDPDPARAALCYEELRQKLIRFFEWERSEMPDRDADETLNRVARRLAEGVEMRSPGAFAHGIARFILREQAAAAKRKERALAEFVAQPRMEPNPQDQALHNCLEHCLASLPPEARWLLEKYYSGAAGEQIPNRRALAEELRLGANALRNRVLRLRARLESCLNDCTKKHSDETTFSPTQDREA